MAAMILGMHFAAISRIRFNIDVRVFVYVVYADMYSFSKVFVVVALSYCCAKVLRPQ